MWSSTYVRTCLATGDVAGAAEALGRPFAVRGSSSRATSAARSSATPPPTCRPRGGGHPADGVYAGWLRRLDTGERFPAAISVGTNPTFDGHRERRVESYVLDRTDLDWPRRRGRGLVRDRLRGMAAFDSVDELVAQMTTASSSARRAPVLDVAPGAGRPAAAAARDGDLVSPARAALLRPGGGSRCPRPPAAAPCP